MSMEMRALKSILAVKGIELPTDVEAVNPVSEFVSEMFLKRYPDNEVVTILRDLSVDWANNEPMSVLQEIHKLNFEVVEFSRKEETQAYIKELNADTNE